LSDAYLGVPTLVPEAEDLGKVFSVPHHVEQYCKASAQNRIDFSRFVRPIGWPTDIVQYLEARMLGC